MDEKPITEQYDLRRYTLARLRGFVDGCLKQGCARLLRRILDGETIDPDKCTLEERFVLGGIGLSHDAKRIGIVLGDPYWRPKVIRGRCDEEQETKLLHTNTG